MKKSISYVLLGISLIFIAVLLFLFASYFTGNITKTNCNYHTADINNDWKITSEETQNMDYCRVYPSFAGCDIYVQPIDSTHVQNADFLRRQGLGEYACNETGSYPTKWIAGIVVEPPQEYDYVFTGQERTLNWTQTYDFRNNYLQAISQDETNVFFLGDNVEIQPKETLSYDDLSANSNIARCFMSTTCPKVIDSGVSGKSVKFDGLNDELVVDNDVSLNPNYITISYWVKYDKGSYNRPIMKGDGQFTNGYALRSNHLGSLGFLAGTNYSYDSLEATISPQFGYTKWSHVVVTLDGQYKRVYVDNVLMGEKQFNHQIYPNNLKLQIGNLLNGSLDEVRIYNRALSRTEITSLYSLGTINSGLVAYWSFDSPIEVQRSARIFDYNNKVVYQGNLPVVLNSSALGVGHYFVETPGDRIQFAVIPRDYDGNDHLSSMPLYPGAETHGRVLLQKPRYTRIGAGCKWDYVQTSATQSPSSWNWVSSGEGSCDTVINDNYNAGYKVVLQPGREPSWLKNDPNKADKFVELYSTFLAEAAKRYNGKLYAIEVWNEPSLNNMPNIGNYPSNNDGIAQAYFDLLVPSYNKIKQVNSSIRVMGPAWQSGTDRGGGWVTMTQYLVNVGANNYLDDFSWHDYGLGYKYNLDYYVGPDKSITGAPRTDLAVEAMEATGINRPYHVNELGLPGQSALGSPAPDRPEMPWFDSFAQTTKIIIMYLSAGVESIQVQLFTDANPGNVTPHYDGGWECGSICGAGIQYSYIRGPRPKSSALLMTNYWLNDASFVSKRVLDNETLFMFAWQKNNEVRVFSWTYKDNLVPVLGYLAARDIYGRDIFVTGLGEEPVIFYSSTKTADQLMDEIQALTGY